MKSITATIAILLSITSNSAAYEFDPVRDKRARDFYGNFVNAEIEKFNPDEDTMFFTRKVGGQVCAAIDQYAVFDFKRLEKFTIGKKKQAYQVLEPGASEDDPAKLALIYQVCGTPFTPDASKVNTKATNIISDEASCKALA